MKTSRRRNRPTSISNSRWAAYAAAGAATVAVGIPAAEGEIHYSGIVNYPFPGGQPGSHASFPLNNGASLLFSHGSDGIDGFAHLRIPAPGLFQSFGAFVGNIVTYGGFYLSNLNTRINLSGLRFRNSCRYNSSRSIVDCYGGTIGRGGGYSTSSGHFRERGTGIIGFVFNTGAGNQYGWVRIKTSGIPKDRFIVVDYAWGDPGDAIQTGQRHDHPEATAISKAGSLGSLALGGVGLTAWRQLRQPSGQ